MADFRVPYPKSVRKAICAETPQVRLQGHRVAIGPLPRLTVPVPPNDIVERIAAEHAARHVDMVLAKFAAVQAITESPIEAAMCCAILGEFCERGWAMHQSVGICKFIDARFSPHDILIVPQYPVGKFRADIMVVVRDVSPERLFAVECDGKEHHQSSMGQVNRDNFRDRCFSERGIFTMRYSGAEIVADPIRCAVGVVRTVNRNAYGVISQRGE